jgi:hypothetical protein
MRSRVIGDRRDRESSMLSLSHQPRFSGGESQASIAPTRRDCTPKVSRVDRAEEHPRRSVNYCGAAQLAVYQVDMCRSNTANTSGSE